MCQRRGKLFELIDSLVIDIKIIYQKKKKIGNLIAIGRCPIVDYFTGFVDVVRLNSLIIYIKVYLSVKYN